MSTEENTESRRALKALANALLGAGITSVAYSGYAGGKEDFLAVASISLLLLGTSAFTGGILGFLFGIPRTLQGDPGKAASSSSPEATAKGSIQNPPAPLKLTTEPGTDYIANTNLEQISDWLTKILVGVGLTQLSAIKQGIGSIDASISPARGPVTYAGSFAVCALLFGLIVGFLFGYLWTRLFLIGAFRQADRIGILTAQIKRATEKAEVAEQQVDELKRQVELDAEALNLIDRQLNPRPDTPPPAPKAIEEAVLNASKSVKTQIYYRARDFRSKTWSDPSSKAAMELTIPVFRALIACDKERWYHANHGQLAYALKDKTEPNYAEAEKEFTTAIDIRDRLGEIGWVFYELYRAVCIIKQDANFAGQQISDEKIRRRVVSDLKRAFEDEVAKHIARQDMVISEWCKLNTIDINSLKDS